MLREDSAENETESPSAVQPSLSVIYEHFASYRSYHVQSQSVSSLSLTYKIS
jgi:hypothetical protein